MIRMILFKVSYSRLSVLNYRPRYLSYEVLDYSKPHKVGNRIKAKQCWDSLYITLKD